LRITFRFQPIAEVDEGTNAIAFFRIGSQINRSDQLGFELKNNAGKIAKEMPTQRHRRYRLRNVLSAVQALAAERRLIQGLFEM
jgi:hypothetical protein